MEKVGGDNNLNKDKIKNKFAGIVTYNPDIKRLVENITSISNQVDVLYIVDNCSRNIDEIKSNLCNYSNISLYENKENKGIAQALNVILSNAENDGAKWVLLLDQDSVVPDNIINSYSNYINILNAALLCPVIYDNNKAKKVEPYIGTREIGICLTSGSYVNVRIWKEIGKFREELFIDSVDNEYCLRVFFKGYKTYEVGNVILNHELGHSVKKVFKSVTNHNSFRRYYIARNSMAVALHYKKLAKKRNYTRKEYKKIRNFLEWDISPARILLRQFQFALLVLLYEKDKYNKIKSIIKGVYDGCLMKVGNLR